jgi:putative transposase
MTNTRQTYQTDVNDRAWKVIKKMLPAASGNGRPRKYELREIVNAIFYVVRGGIAWRLMPHDLPPWSLVYNYYWHWKQAGVFEAMNAKLVELSRKNLGRRRQPSMGSMGIMDSQSVKTANGGEDRGIDGNKKIHGRKRHVVTDTVGHLLAVKVTAANVSDQVGGRQVLTVLSNREQGERQQQPYRLRKILVDGAYQGIVAAILILFGWILEVTKKPEGVKGQGFVVQPTRWVIERFHAWQGRYRRLSKDYECTTASSEAMCYLASIHRLAAKFV